MIRTIEDLIERLEAIKADIPARGLSLTEYEQVGWAPRHLEALLERCREEADSFAWTTTHQARASAALTRLKGSTWPPPRGTGRDPEA